MNSQEYIEVAIKIEPYSSENAEIVTAELAELPFESFMEEEGLLKCYIQKELYDSRALKLLVSAMDGYDFRLSYTSALVPPVNWNARWESDFQPIVVDGKCTIKAPYHKDLKRTRFNITIEPNMAFGTGHHQTTYMMCRALLENEAWVRGKQVMDMGCGTAVLTVLAAKMKAAKVRGIDIDAIAAASASGAGLSATKLSVVSTQAAMDAAFSREERVTLVGSTIPSEIMSTYCSV